MQMPEPIAEQIVRQAKAADQSYYRLVLVVATAGKTRAMRDAASQLGITVINLNLELSRRMLDLTERQRSLQLPRLLDAIVNGAPGKVVFLDNLEMLFDTTLKQDPLRLLQSVSRNRSIVATWNGKVEKEYLTYATPGHPEYRRYPAAGLTIVTSAFEAS
jgi:hypothetical protein